ncbi:MAG TPA: hypothetical protein VE860_27480 [Chthoniobacterales bacterium]|nr:hypothetical protein [Chthoniobacterales bacterium]
MNSQQIRLTRTKDHGKHEDGSLGEALKVWFRLAPLLGTRCKVAIDHIAIPKFLLICQNGTTVRLRKANPAPNKAIHREQRRAISFMGECGNNVASPSSTDPAAPARTRVTGRR